VKSFIARILLYDHGIVSVKKGTVNWCIKEGLVDCQIGYIMCCQVNIRLRLMSSYFKF
jgi:hypothetical protein